MHITLGEKLLFAIIGLLFVGIFIASFGIKLFAIAGIIAVFGYLIFG